MATKNTLDSLVGRVVVDLASGRPSGAAFRGNIDETTAVQRAVDATRQLHEEIHRKEASIDSIVEKLEKKRAATQEFKRILGIPFPL